MTVNGEADKGQNASIDSGTGENSGQLPDAAFAHSAEQQQTATSSEAFTASSPPVDNNTVISGDLDYTQEIIRKGQVAAPQVGGTYDPRPQEDGARRIIAYSLIGLLWAVVGATFLLLWCNRIVVADIKEFAVILGPVVTLVSAATGFYYGTKSVQSNDS